MADATEVAPAAVLPELPESVTSGRKRRRWPRVLAAVVVLAAIAVLAGGLAMRANSSTPSYRTIAATQQQVQSVLHGVGVIEPVNQAAVAFPISGIVASVNVKAGDQVTAGQPLAALDTTALTAALHQKQQALDQANLTLQKALNGQSVTPTAINQAVRDEPTAVLLAAVTSAIDPQVATDEQAVATAQQDVDAARNQASAALSSATTVCAAIGQGGQTDPTTAVNACTTALQNVQTAQAAVTKAQTTLANASKTLDTLLTKIANEPPPTAPPTTAPPTTTVTAPPFSTPPNSTPPVSTAPPSTAPSNEGPGGPPTSEGGPPTSGGGSATRGRTGGLSGGGSSSRASGGGSSSRAPTAADIASYQSAVDAAQSDLTVAQQAIAQATIVSPIDGTVLSVGIKPGQNAQATSTTQTVVVQGGGGYEATTTVSVDDIPKVQAGQAATVTPDGAAAPVTGKVISIATVPITTTTSTNYRVVISLPPDATTLHNGSIGAVGIVTGTATGVSVPTSAITTNGGVHTVTVLDGNTTQQVVVQVGVVGDTWTQVTRGLDAGQQVVLADVNAPLPSSATDTSARNAQNGNRILFPIGNNATTRTRTG